MNYDVLTVGSAIVDAILSLDHSNFVHISKAEKELRIASGQKIPVKSSGIFPGGNACNVAVGLARAGINTAMMAELAQDEFADHITNMLIRESVGLEYITRSQGATVLNVALNFNGDRTLFTHHLERPHDFHVDEVSAKVIYLTSLGHQWRHVYKKVAEHLVKQTSLLAFNPGSTQLAEGTSSYAYLLPLTTILFVNKEEAEIISGEKGSMDHILTRLKSMGPKIVSITQGQRGAYAIDERGIIYHKEALDCPVVESTGAGDAYASGFLAGYLQGQAVEKSMSWGIHNSAAVIGQNGAQAGLLSKKELEERV